MSAWRAFLVCGTIAAAAAGVQFFTGPAVSLAQPLHDFPFQIGSWTGRVEPAHPSLLQRARPDAFVHRQYVGARGESVFLYIGYYARQASRGQALAACPGRCMIVDHAVVDMTIADRPVQVNREYVMTERGPMAVAYWFQRGQNVIADPYRNKVRQVWTGLASRRSNGAVVRISTPIDREPQAAWADLISFARAASPLIFNMLEE